jgi:hypothetical protein
MKKMVIVSFMVFILLFSFINSEAKEVKSIKNIWTNFLEILGLKKEAVGVRTQFNGQGYLNINSFPAGAKVLVKIANAPKTTPFQEIGSTPLQNYRLDVKSKTGTNYKIILRKDGYKDKYITVRIKNSLMTTPKLIKIPVDAKYVKKITINAVDRDSKSLKNAEVYLDNIKVGKTNAKGKATINNMGPGSYNLKFKQGNTEYIEQTPYNVVLQENTKNNKNKYVPLILSRQLSAKEGRINTVEKQNCVSNTCNPNDNKEICSNGNFIKCEVAYPGTSFCTDNLCSSHCIDFCNPSGSKRCFENGYQTCGNYDNDPCLEWSTTTNCNAGIGETCSNGLCSTSCTNECSTSGNKQCSGNSYKTCGNYDADSCLEWSTTDCDIGETCSNGQCVEIPSNWTINSTPSGADVYIDNENFSRGITPLTINNLQPIYHDILLKKLDYQNYEDYEILFAGERFISEYTLVYDLGILSITAFKPDGVTKLSGVKIYLNDVDTGLTTSSTQAVSLIKPSGDYTLKLTKTGYIDYIDEYITIEPENEITEVEATMEKP